ncbi:MAG: DUF2752 domain-containing protein, partial [Planctomycetota bacterium]
DATPRQPSWRPPARLVGAALLLLMVAIVGLAAWMDADSRGFGTHQQLGLPACGTLQRTGYPCPTCGMTRGFRAMAHGQVRASFGYHPFAPVLFAATAAVAAAGTVQAVTGKALLSRTRVWWWILLANGVLAGWAIKVAIGRADGTYPLG